MQNYFEMALKEAKKAFKKDEIPVGAVIVKDSRIIAKSHNNRQKKHWIFGHAEINCILKAEKKIKDWRLDECELYVTLEPCDMCKIFIKEARIKKINYILTRNGKNINDTNVREETCGEYKRLLQAFFENLRQ